MKRFLLYLLTVVSIVACSEGEPADNGSDDGGGNTPTTPTITLNKSSVSFDELADEESISFSTTADWIAEIVNDRADGWLSVTPQSGSAGDASITIKAKENDTPDERNASVRIKAGSASKTISVSQKQKDALTVTASKFEVETEGGEVKIEVKANIDFEYAIDESAKEWIKYEGTRAIKTSTLTFSVAENDDTEKREGKIAIKSGEFNEVVTIYQAGSEPSIVISQNEYVVSSDGETISVEVSSNVDVAVEMPTDADWISENTTRATSTNTYRFDIQPNEDYDQRTAEIKFTNKENNISEVVKVTQVQKDALVVAKESYTVESDGGQLHIEVGHNVDFDIEISNDWITKAENTRAFVTETLNFNIAKNPTTDNREGTIVFKSKDGKLTQTVKVYQAQEDALIISKKDIVVSDEGGTISFELQTNVEFTVSEPDVDWLRAVTTRGLTTHTLNYTVDANTSYDSREAKIVVTDTKNNKSETITITQTQKDAIVLAKDSYTVDSDGGALQIEVGHNVDFDIEISNDWITKTENTRAFVTETLVFNIAKNPTTDNREGAIIFKSKDGKLTQTVKVYQAQEDALIISKKDIVVSDEGGTISFELQTNVEFKVSDPDVDWLRPVVTRGLTTHTLHYEYDANSSYDSREAKIVVTDTKNNKSETITITQAQKDAIVLAKSEYEFGVDGGNLDFEIQTNVDIIVTISDNSKDWIQQVETRALETKTLYFNVSACSAEEDREGTITISGGNATQTITVKQSGLKEILEKEREALIAFYNATGGDNWTRNDNWCSDKPIEEWYGITVENGVVTNIDLRNNNLSGVISNELNKIISLKELNIDGNHLTSLTLQNNPSLEAIICNNNKLTTLDVAGNESLGTLQCNDNTLESISLMSCKNLHTLFCDNNLLRSLNLSDCIGLRSLSIRNNKLTSLDISSCSKLFNLDCSGNQLSTLEIIDKSDLLYLWCSGNLLESLTVSNCKLLESILCDNNKLTGTKLKFYNCPNIETLWCHQNNLETLDVTSLTKLKSLWCGNFNGFEGSTISTLDISQNTLLEQFSCYGLKLTTIDVSNNPHLWKLECSGNPITSLDLSSLVNLKELWCHSMDLSDDLDISNNVELEGLYCFNNPNLAKIIISNEQEFSYEKDKTTKFCIKGSDVLYDEFPYYASTDYSKDGTVTILQKASVGKGINIVLMGDAFSDRLIDDGTYENTMKLTMENFFSIEPYTSHRDFFNVYSVTAVSKNEMCSSHSSTALSCLIGAGGNDDKVFAYAQKAVGENEIEDTAIIVILNEPLSEVTHDGLCRLWTPSSGANDYGKGSSIAYICRGSNDEIFESVIHHEAGGHGFAKLGDEYTEYSDMLQIPDNIIEEIKTLSEYGWLKNIDLTNDPITIKWSKFLNDNRYSNEQITADLGIFEGAYYYKNGAFRPSWNGVMNNHLYMNFNAPSREAIYYRIHKLAYGADWEYDYEEFVEWDARNRSTASATRGVPYRMEEPKDFKPLHAPVVMKTSWRNAKNNAPAKNATRSMGGNAGHNMQKSAGTTSHATAKPMTASTSITLPDGSVRTTTISSSGATKVEYKKTNK